MLPARLNRLSIWNQNKKLPRMFPGIIFSGVATSALSMEYLATGPTMLLLVLGWLALLIGSIYWTFCVFRISSLLQYKSSILKAVDRTLAIPISLVYNPAATELSVYVAEFASAFLMANLFQAVQSWNPPQPTRAWAFTGMCAIDIIIGMIPMITIPAITIGWTYKFFAKLAQVNEVQDKHKFSRIRLPAILVTVCNLSGFLCNFYFYCNTDNLLSESALKGMGELVLLSNLLQALSFFILWRCVKGKKAIVISYPS
jgi:hypothetical protein